MSTQSQSEPFEESKPTKIPIILGFFDVLGFSERVKTEGPDQTAALYERLIKSTLAKEKDRCLGSVPDDKGNRYLVVFSLDVKHAYFSDTIFLWVPLQPMFAGAFVNHCATFVCEALALNVPVRGAIAIGDAIMHRPSGTYIGMPIVEAAGCEKVQDWVGVVFAESATWPPFLAELNPTSVIEYEVPVKPDAKADLPPLALDWPRRWKELFSTSAEVKLEELSSKKAHSKLANTIQFVKHCDANLDWHTRPATEQEGSRLRMVQMPNDEIGVAAKPMADSS
ncbi:MAG: hypothetical protein ACREC0_12850 [Methylocella sp.]